MKICEKCGACNSDDRFFCVNCGEKLGKKASSDFAELTERNIDAALDRLYDRQNPLNVSMLDRAVGIYSAVGIACAVFAGFQNGFLYFVYIVIPFLLSLLDSFFPSLMWGIEKLRLGFSVADADNATPSDFYRVMRRVANVILCVMGTVLAVFIIYGGIFHPESL